MGCYVNPKGMAKEDWLKNNAKLRGAIGKGDLKAMNTAIPEYSSFPEGTMPVVLVDNGPFTAAGVAFSKEEYECFTDLGDHRVRIIFEAKVVDLLQVSDLKDYMK
jgi:hypothetical protein